MNGVFKFLVASSRAGTQLRKCNSSSVRPSVRDHSQDHTGRNSLRGIKPRSGLFKIGGSFELNFLLWGQFYSWDYKCHEWGVKKPGTKVRLSVPDWRHVVNGHCLCNGWCCLTQRKIPWTFRIVIFIKSVSGIGVRRRVTWRCWGFLTRHVEIRVILDVIDIFTLRKIP